MYFQKAFIVNLFVTSFFSVAEQELHHDFGVGARALSQYGSGSNCSSYRPNFRSEHFSN
jgi:hypothetical protein